MNTLKVFAYIGTNQRNSRIEKTVCGIINSLEKEARVDSNIHLSKFIQATSCQGCLNCFIEQKCPLDKNDAFAEMKQQMLEADLIFLATPIYLLNVSGSMKNFLDRIAYWTHLMALRGKKAVIVASTSSTGMDFVQNYMKLILTYLGCSVIGKIELYDGEKFIQKDYDYWAKNIYKIFINQKDMISEDVEQIFSSLQINMKKLEFETNEKKYWRENNMLNVSSLSELVLEEKHGKIR